MTAKRAGLALLPALLAASLLGCSSDRAELADCQAIFDRIVELELREIGFRDPELLERKRAALSAQYRGEIERCVGRPLREGALACVASARSTEALSHECLH